MMPSNAGPRTDEPFVSLYRRFRPTKLSEIRGQPHVVQALRGAVADGHVSHAYLFSGPRGTGKTSAARVLAKALNCVTPQDGEPCGVCASCVSIAQGTSLDVRELDAASNNGVDAMRDLVSHAALATPGQWKLYIVDEVHMLSSAAANALLKTLEEPPPHVVFVLATTDPQKVPSTVRSRTQHYEFRLLGAETLAELLSWVRDEASLDLDDEALALAVRRGRGSARDALSALDQMASAGSAEGVRPELGGLVDALCDEDAAQTLVNVAALVEAGWSPQQLASEVVDDLRQAFLLSLAPELASTSGSERERLGSQAERLGLARLVRAMEALGLAQVDMREAPDARVVLEVTLVRLARSDLDSAPDALAERLARLERTLTPRATLATHEAPSAPDTSRDRSPDVAAPEPPRLVRPEPPTVAEVRPPADPRSRPAIGALRRQRAEQNARAAEPGAPTRDAPPPPPVSAPPTAATTPAQASTAAVPDRDTLVEAWGDHLLRALPARAKALYSSGRFSAVEGATAVFALPNTGYLRRCEEVRPLVEEALGAHFGTRLTLRLIVDEPGTSGPDAGVAASEPDPTDLGDDDFDPEDPGEPHVVESLVHSRILEAFPGAEEVPT
jgi:DNA polymerase-3 subunit gamma/tau